MEGESFLTIVLWIAFFYLLFKPSKKSKKRRSSGGGSSSYFTWLNDYNQRSSKWYDHERNNGHIF